MDVVQPFPKEAERNPYLLTDGGLVIVVRRIEHKELLMS